MSRLKDINICVIKLFFVCFTDGAENGKWCSFFIKIACEIWRTFSCDVSGDWCRRYCRLDVVKSVSASKTSLPQLRKLFRQKPNIPEVSVIPWNRLRSSIHWLISFHVYPLSKVRISAKNQAKNFMLAVQATQRMLIRHVFLKCNRSFSFFFQSWVTSLFAPYWCFLIL